MLSSHGLTSIQLALHWVTMSRVLAVKVFMQAVRCSFTTMTWLARSSNVPIQ